MAKDDMGTRMPDMMKLVEGMGGESEGSGFLQEAGPATRTQKITVKLPAYPGEGEGEGPTVEVIVTTGPTNLDIDITSVGVMRDPAEYAEVMSLIKQLV